MYFFKCGYFIFSAIQMVAGYPTRILGYFVGKNYSIVFGAAFLCEWNREEGEKKESDGRAEGEEREVGRGIRRMRKI